MSTVTLSQRHQALEQANRVRCARAAFKQNVEAMSGPESAYAVASLVQKPADWACTWQIAQVLRHVRTSRRKRVPRPVVARWLVRVRVSGLVTLGELSVRQRAALAAELVRHAGGLGGGSVY